MKKFLAIVVLVLFWCNSVLAVSLPKDVVSGSKFTKSLTGSYYKKYGMQVVDKKDGHPVRAGEKSIRFEVRAGDCGKDKDGGWNDCEKDRERHELSGKYRVSKGERWYAWSIYLPNDFINVYPTSTMLAQFHQEKKHVIWMFKNKRGGYWVENYVPKHTIENVKILTKEQMLGNWNDILINVNWSHKDDGFFKVWANDKLVYDFKGKTKSKGVKTYFKFGIYRSWIKKYKQYHKVNEVPTQVVYYDEVRVGKEKKDVVGNLPPNEYKAKIEPAAAKYRAIVKNKIDSSILIKAEGPTKEAAEKEAMKICIGKSIQSSFKEACYVHYSGPKPDYEM